MTPAEDGLLCDRCCLLYEIRDDIPIMLIDEAKKIEDKGEHYEFLKDPDRICVQN